MSSRNVITLDTTVKAAADQTSTRVEDETIILHLAQGTYFGLDPVGTWLWTQLQQPVSVRRLRDQILAEFETTREQCEPELLRLLDELVSEELIEVVQHGPSA